MPALRRAQHARFSYGEVVKQLPSIPECLRRSRAKKCIGCEERPIRKTGEFESWLEGMSEQRLYCQECIDADWDADPDSAKDSS